MKLVSTDSFGSIKAFFSGKDGRVRLLMILGVSGLLLILISSLMPSSPSRSGVAVVASQGDVDTEVYIEQLEKRIYDIVSNIEGAGNTKVMITLESGMEYVYAQQNKVTTDSTQDISGETSQRTQEKNSSENTYVFVENENGRKQALVELRKEPKVQGVVILCQGADNTLVEARIIEAVTTALNISSTRVCVTKISQ